MDWLTGLEGTPAGHNLALVLALTAAILHAIFGALQKGRHDPWISRMAMDLSYGLIALPFALFVVPWPEPHMWPIFGGAMVIHLCYKLAQGFTYVKGAYTVVYPVVRGTGPLFAVIGAMIVFDESYSALQWVGIGVLLTGIFGLAVYNFIFLTVQRDTLVPALALAVLTGLFVALYTTYDAYGIRATANPFTFLMWFFALDGLLFPPLVAIFHRRAVARIDDWPALARRGITGGLVALGSFGSIMMATRLDKVGEAAVLRETSTVFAALIGWIMLGEKVGPRRLVLMALIALGAVIVEFSG
ncbi:EamA-like transporter family protein [Rhodobacteraceae bacterium THAF1]|uniref:EamA family transporter n=1 Tax=Palleronia sp. THAF1 TaxID=2587842 RepID=UPI000F3DB9BA|nr:EamA family transporter [Palleronia sp. THAF1]QFU07471.1 EamA-like transporter family protein [Palleronia sp. THAF1]VDC20399.1 EamA-like transporter family protein [Rhodobacteraceae bacterium THAF1]